MRVPYEWLGTFLGDALPPLERTVELLDGLGLAVETVHELDGAPAGVVVVEVLEVEAIEGSDHLREVLVSDGERRFTVVCGAPNVAVGVRSALALPGAKLPSGAHRANDMHHGRGAHSQDDADPASGGHAANTADPASGETTTVAARTLQGVRSHGMLASPRELGLYDHAGGIILFGADATLGAALAELWPGERVIELELTPNRGDAFSMLGVARDLAAKLRVPLHDPSREMATEVGVAEGDADGLRIEVLDPVACPRMTLRAVGGVRVGPSPIWLQRRLAALGLRPRNNVVDLTNYVTYELGQPSHAYDRRVLRGGVMQVRRAEAGKTLTLLNEQTITLSADDLVIATPDGEGGSRAIGLAGVMGGLHDSVVADTRDLALELAHFDPGVIRRSARRNKLASDAHLRFERGVDPDLPPRASARLAGLIQEVAGGTLSAGFAQVGGDAPVVHVPFRPSRVAFLTGMEVALPEQREALTRLGCQVEERAPDAWEVTVPSWRFDLRLEVDLIEEVARLHGYEHIGDTVPNMHFVPPSNDPTHRALRDTLAAMGHQETMNYVFTGDAELARSGAPAAVVRLTEPQGVERAVLRTALLPGLLGTAAANHAEPSLALFEVGHVFGEQEEERLGLLWRGAWIDGIWRPGTKLDFFLAKGILESLAALHGAELRCEPTQVPWLHPGVAASLRWDDVPVGALGQLHPEVAASYGLPETYVAELTLPLASRDVRFEEVPRQPYAERDLAVIAPDAVAYETLARIVTEAAGDRLVSMTAFDVYQGPQLAEGHRSVALRLRFRHPERALTDEEVDGSMANVIGSVRDAGYGIRT